MKIERFSKPQILNRYAQANIFPQIFDPKNIYEESLTTDGIGQAWQYRVRKQKEAEEKDNPYWENLDLSVANSVVRPIDISLAKQIIEEYEWLGCMPAIVSFCYGIFFKDLATGDEVCGGAVVYGKEYSENLGVWDKYGFTGKILLLARGVCLHWTKKNTNSHLIMESMKQLPPQYEVITCTTDNLAGEVGTIYQACNFDYVGSMRKGKERVGCIINGKLYGSRSLRAKFGSQKQEDILAICPNAKFVTQKSKDRYFAFRGDKRTRKKNRKAIEHLILPYPKRPKYAEPSTYTESAAPAKESTERAPIINDKGYLRTAKYSVGNTKDYKQGDIWQNI